MPANPFTEPDPASGVVPRSVTGTRARVRAPGRVNLIGDHTDYQDGFCLPMAIDREVVIDFAPRADAEVGLMSSHADAGFDAIVAAAIGVLDEGGRPPVGIEGTLTSTVPVGAGLSSSAAVEVAICRALAYAARWPLGGRALARAAQEVEHRASGMPCGVLDQMASVFGVAGHALLLDCRSLEVDPLPLPAGTEVLVVHSGVERRLATSAYAERRAACEAAAAHLGVPALRDATPQQVADDPIARHVVSENARTLAFAEALRRNDVDALGPLMIASHASLRDDFRVSVPEVDLLVDLCLEHGAIGARMTGGGFGGCVVMLVAPAGRDTATVAATIADRYRAVTGLTATPYVVHAVDGAAVLPAR
jgi:galactokinase